MMQEIVGELRRLKKLAEDALAQVEDADFFASLDAESNGLAVQVKHVAGNLRSRWTDFLTTDGEKPDRNRDGEFELEQDTRAVLMQRWEDGWSRFLGTVEALADDDLDRTVTIRDEPLTVRTAVVRGLGHAAYHVGQIVLLAKHYAGPRWRSLSMARAPRGARVQPPEERAANPPS
jgi:hypothetical protein